MTELTERDIRKAAEAHTDLAVFAAIEALLTNSLLSSRAGDDEHRMQKLCVAARTRAFVRYEAACAGIIDQAEQST